MQTERYDLEERVITAEIDGPRDRAYALNTCPDCGWDEGMSAFDRKSVRFIVEQEAEFPFPEEWWISRDDRGVPSSYIHYLYRRCGTCRPMGAPDDWTQVREKYVKEWAAIRCYCVDCQLKGCR